MKPKIKTGISAIMIIGWIFAGLGSVFLIMGILFLTQSGKEEAFKMLGLIFGGTGLFFFLIGVIFLIFASPSIMAYTARNIVIITTITLF